MPTPRRLGSVPQPVRSAVVGGVLLAIVGLVYGLIESVRDYPASSWFGVTLYVVLLGALAGFLLGVVVGALRMFVRLPARRHSRSRP